MNSTAVASDVLAKLSPLYRAMVALRFTCKWSYDEIATRLGMPIDVVQQHIHDALVQAQLPTRQAHEDDVHCQHCGKTISDTVGDQLRQAAMWRELCSELSSGDQGAMLSQIPTEVLQDEIRRRG